MSMKQNRYSRKINQFRNTARQVNELIESRRWQTMTENTKHQFQWKLNHLFETVRNFLSKKELKKILATAAFLICIGTVNAQTFAPSVTNPYGLTDAGYVNFPSFTDLDSDGDLDIISLTNYGEVKYFENTGTPTTPAFNAPLTNPFGLVYDPNSYRPVTADLDNDGDLDIFVGEYYGAYKYYENTGTTSSPSFVLPVLNPFGLDSAFEVGHPAFADFDNDGDADLLCSEYYAVFKYYQNEGTAAAPNFAAPTSNPYNLYPGSIEGAFPTIADLDNDGDFDVLTGSWLGVFYYYQNTGNNTSPDFAYPLTDPFGLTDIGLQSVPSFGDLDNDGDIDLLVGGDTLGNFIYFENTTFSSVDDFNSSVSFSVSPNPATDYFTIYTNAGENNYSLSIKDITGKLVYKYLTENSETTVNTSGYGKGVYIIELSEGNKISRKKLIIE